MTKTQVFQFSFLAILWVFFCYALIKSTPVVTLRTIFAIVASAIIVFVPLYKKYVRNGKAGKQ